MGWGSVQHPFSSVQPASSGTSMAESAETILWAGPIHIFAMFHMQDLCLHFNTQFSNSMCSKLALFWVVSSDVSRQVGMPLRFHITKCCFILMSSGPLLAHSFIQEILTENLLAPGDTAVNDTHSRLCSRCCPWLCASFLLSDLVLTRC